MVKKLLLVAAMSVVLAACSTQSFTMGRNATATPKVDDMQTFFVAGLGQTQTINAAEVCGGASKVAKVESQMTFLNGLLGGLTFNIYTPRQARVYCTR